MREDAFQYHQRVVNDFAQAIINKQDARDEAVNVLLSANNLENHGYSHIPFREEAENFLKGPQLQIKTPTEKGMERIFSGGETRAEPAPQRHHKPRQLFNSDKWSEANENLNEDEIDKMVRKAVGFRFEDSIPNLRDFSSDEIIGNHSKFKTLGLHPPRVGEISYNEKPLWQQLARFLFINNGANAERLHDAMVKTAKGLHPVLKQIHHFSDWRGNNASILKVFNRGLEDYKESFAKRFGHAHPVLSHAQLNELFLRQKFWENEGVSRQQAFDILYNDGGFPRTFSDEGDITPVEQLRAIADAKRKRRSRPMEGEENHGIVGDDAWRYGIALLPYDDIYKIKKWLLTTNGGMKDDGTVGNDDVIKDILGPDARGYMANHAFMIDNMLNELYAGNPLKNGMSHVLPNRFTAKGRAEMKNQMAQREQDLIKKFERNNWFNIDADTLQSALAGFDMKTMAEKYAGKVNAEIIDDGGLYPHIDHSEYGSFIYMSPDFEPRDMKSLVSHNFFEEEELKDIIKVSANLVGQSEYADSIRETVAGYTHTHNVDGEFSMLDKPEVNLTPLGILMEGVGTKRGSAGGESGDFGVAYDNAFPNIFRVELPERAFMIPSRGLKEGGGKAKSVEQQDEFDPKKENDEGQVEQDLLTAMDKYDVDNKDEILARFRNGEVVSLDVPRKVKTTDDIVNEIINPYSNEKRKEEGDDPIRGFEGIDAYTKGMPQLRSPSSLGMNSFMMAHSDALNLLLRSHVGFLSNDNKPVHSTEASLKTPRFTAQKERIGSEKRNARRMFDRKTLSGGKGSGQADKARQFGTKKGNITNELRMAIDALLLGSHHAQHIHDDESLDLLTAILNAKKGERLNILKKGSHKDIIGYGGRTGEDMVKEILEGVEEPSRLALYKKEDFDNNLNHLMSFDKPYELPDHQVKGIKSRNRLIQEIKNRDHEYQQARENDDVDKMANIQQRIEDMLNSEDDVVGYMHDEDENKLSAIVVGPSPASLISQHEAMLGKSLQIARNAGDEILQDVIEKRMQQLREIAQREPSYESSIKNDEDHIQNHIDTILGVGKIFKALRPAIEKIYPNIFAKDNREAHAATAYTLKLAEQILTMSPDARKKLFTGKENIRLGGKKASFDLSPQEVDELVNIKAMRATHEGSDYEDAKQILDSKFGGVQPKGYNVLTHLAQDAKNINEDEIRIFDELIKNVKESAKEQGITFNQAFTARYYPINEAGNPISGIERKRLFDILNIPKRGGNNFVYNEGGIFHGREQLRSGGQSILDKDGKTISLDKERDLIFRLLYNTHQQTRKGSDVALDFKNMKFFKNNEPNIKSVMNFNKLKSIQNIASLISSDTKTDMLDKSTAGEKPTPMGGHNFDHAPVVPIFTSTHKKFHYGEDTNVPFVARPDALNDGMLILEDESNHAYNTLPKQRLFAPRNLRRYVNPSLKPLTAAQQGDRYYGDYAEFSEGQEPNPNTRMGQAVNQAMATSPEPLQSTDDTMRYSSYVLDVALDDTLIIKDDGKPQPIKFMHRIFDLEDMTHLRGFTGDWVISLYPHGEHIIATKKDDKISAYSVDGEVKLDDVFNEEVSKVYEKDFIVHAILHDGIMTVIDLLKTADEDTHNMPTKDRIRHLRAQYESSEHIKMPEPINTKRSDDEGLKTAVEGLRKENDMDILLRDANATYMKGEPRHPKWVLLTQEKMVDVVILSASGKNYTVGVGPLMHPENYGKRAQQVGDEHYMNVGSAKGPRGLKVGDFATVSCTGVSSSKKDNPVYRIRSAKITDNEPLAADSVETLAIMCGDHHIPQQVNMKKGNITILFPAFDDEVICKTRKEDGHWFVEPQSSIWGNDYLVKLARDQEVYWGAKAAWLLKRDEEEPEYDEVVPEPPAGHSKKPKKVLEEEEEVIKRGLELIERGLEHISKEKITSTGVQGLGMDYATPDESPRGPTQNIRDDTMPDFDPQSRTDDELKPATKKKTKRLRTSQGETARLEDDGVVAIEDSSIDIQ